MPDLLDFYSDAEVEESAPSREELIEFIRKICEGEPLFPELRSIVAGQRAIELAAWSLYFRLQKAHEL